MTQDNRCPSSSWAFAACLGLFLSACGGGGGSGGGFSANSISVVNNATWAINRPIEIQFTSPVDFNTVNFNTIQITQVGGAPAAGEFRIKTVKQNPNDPNSADVPVPNTIVFQPACPTLDDFSDAGFIPGGVTYTLNVIGTDTNNPTVQSIDGASLGASQTRTFTTPVGTSVTVLFVDPKVGPPTPLVKLAQGASLPAVSSYLELGGDPTNTVPFFHDPASNADEGAHVDPSFLAGLNLYSVASSQVVAVVVIDQPVNPSSANISTDTVRLEYREGTGSSATWHPVSHTVQLVANCTQTGATLRVSPVGILPQGRLTRVVLSQQFQDITGNANPLDVTVGSFTTSVAFDPGTTNPGDACDEVKEEFVTGGSHPGSDQDTTTALDAPPAHWGNDALAASFDFGGQGGPNGPAGQPFDWHIRALPGTSTTLLQTDFQQILDDTQNPTQTQTVLNGNVDVRNLTIDAGGVLEIKGPNPCKITASGVVTINGKILIKGASNPGVHSILSANISEPGAPGNGGGGRGGTGDVLTTQSSPVGGTGFGAFNVPGGGGLGGESGYNGNAPSTNRRPGGGGGGQLGHDVIRAVGSTCPDQTIIGLDAEAGANGATTALGAITRQSPPQGGAHGPSPFVDVVAGSVPPLPNAANDFWGTMIVGGPGGAPLTGELGKPWSGAGGGGGGNACTTNSFPTSPWLPQLDNKGAGGGGAGGTLTIFALDNIVFGPAGQINASGGSGGGGENTNGFDRIGGGSGGGSGGYVVLQTAKQIDFRTASTTGGNFSIIAKGGQGGSGANDAGGAGVSNSETLPNFDLLPPNAYPSATAPCGVAGNTVGNAPNVTAATGGDGGPGIIQLHTPTLADILIPTGAGITLQGLLKPNPIGTTVATTGLVAGSLNQNLPSTWNQLLPVFGRRSKAISKWIPLGATSVQPGTATPHSIAFKFGDIDTTTGLIQTTGGGANAVVAELPAILTGTIVAEPAVPFVTSDERTVVFDASALVDDIYKRNPALMRRFELKLTHGALVTKLEITSATWDSTTNVIRATVATSGMPLFGLHPSGTTAALIPRFFEVSTNGLLDSLPSTSSIKIEFQAAPANAAGAPNEVLATAFTSNVATLNSAVANTTFRFFRFRVSFDIAADGSNLTFSTPIPSMDFLRIPFRF